jgi:hypothetical protein
VLLRLGLVVACLSLACGRAREPEVDDEPGPCMADHAAMPEADPAGCFSLADEAACEARAGCMPVRGYPADCKGQDCAPGAEERFLGCRPQADCEAAPRLVCGRLDSEVRPVWLWAACDLPGFMDCPEGPGSERPRPDRCG